jgi:hypothetical protein
LKEEELKHLHLLRQASTRAETAYQLVETFLRDGYVSAPDNSLTAGSKMWKPAISKHLNPSRPAFNKTKMPWSQD